MTRSPVISMSDDEEVDDGGISSPSEVCMDSKLTHTNLLITRFVHYTLR